MDDDMLEMSIKEEEPIKLRRPRKIRIPRREPTLILPPFVPHYPSPDKTTCADCTCFPKEEPYRKPKKLTPCQQSPPTLYELSASALESLPYPPALHWTVEDVVRWCEEHLELPQYRECFIDNHIDGHRLLMLEDPSKCPMVNIHDFEHIKKVVHAIRSLYGMDLIQFYRSVGLPPRRPLVHCTWHQSRTGPSWGTRQNWTRADVLRWMKVVLPAPVYRDHWELVWYQRPEFPSVMVGRVSKWKTRPPPAARPASQAGSVCDEHQVPRKFRLLVNIPEKDQLIWIKRTPEEIEQMKRKEEEEAKRKEGGKRREGDKRKKKREFHFTISKESHLLMKPVSQEGKRGDQLILARRKINKPKFLAF